MLKYINHYTWNTGNNRQSRPEEVEKDMHLYLRRLIRDALTHKKVDVLDDTYIELAKEENSYVMTLYKKQEEKDIPLLVSCGCSEKEESAYVLQSVSGIYQAFYGDSQKIIPLAPFCVDVILPTIIEYLEVTQWTADFTRCMAWMLLSPESIQP